MLTERQRALLLLLINTSGTRSGKSLADHLGVSVKTIQRDIAELNELFQKDGFVINAVRGFGYDLDPRSKTFILDHYFYDDGYDKHVIPDTKDARIAWMIRKLVMNVLYGRKETIPELALALYISEGSIQRYLLDIRHELSHYDLTLAHDRVGIYLTGDERNLRKIINDYLLDENRGLNAEVRFQHGPHRNDIVVGIVLRALRKQGIYLTDIGFMNLVMHLEIALMRIEQGNYDMRYSDGVESPDQSVWSCAVEIATGLQEALHITIPKQEVVNIYIHLSSQKKMLSEHPDDLDENHVLTHVLRAALNDIKDIYNIDYRQDGVLLHGLSVHLESALNRLRYGLVIHNDLLDAIEKNYSFDMQVTMILVHHVELNYDVTLNQDEIGFLTLHFCGAHERLRSRNDDKLRAMIVCTTGMGTAMLLKAKLATAFKDQLEVVRVTSYMEYQEQNYADIDIIISTIQFQHDHHIPVVVISAIASNADMAIISETIHADQHHKILRTLFDDALIERFTCPVSRETVLDTLAQRAWEHGYIDESCIVSVKQREAMGSTEIGNHVAIPHNMAGGVHRPCVVVGIMETPIHWEFDTVQLVLMILLDDQARAKDANLFESIYALIDTPHKVETIIKKGRVDCIQYTPKEDL